MPATVLSALHTITLYSPQSFDIETVIIIPALHMKKLRHTLLKEHATKKGICVRIQTQAIWWTSSHCQSGGSTDCDMWKTTDSGNWRMKKI